MLTGFQAKAQAPAAASARFLGTVTAVNGTTLTVKTDAGEIHQVDVPATAQLKQVEPGAKDLSTAQTIQFNTLATGDRVLVRLDPNAPAGSKCGPAGYCRKTGGSGKEAGEGARGLGAAWRRRIGERASIRAPEQS